MRFHAVTMLSSSSTTRTVFIFACCTRVPSLQRQTLLPLVPMQPVDPARLREAPLRPVSPITSTGALSGSESSQFHAHSASDAVEIQEVSHFIVGDRKTAR